MLASLSLTSMKIVSWSLLYLTSGPEFSKAYEIMLKIPKLFSRPVHGKDSPHICLEDMSVCVWDIGKGPLLLGGLVNAAVVNAAICG